jgi:hypothetical protein
MVDTGKCWEEEGGRLRSRFEELCLVIAFSVFVITVLVGVWHTIKLPEHLFDVFEVRYKHRECSLDKPQTYAVVRKSGPVDVLVLTVSLDLLAVLLYFN